MKEEFGIKKDTNPKDAIGIRKVPFSVLPFPVIAEAALGMMEGALKYGRHNYRAIGVRVSVYIDAAMRHITAYWEGEDIDPDSGLPHIVKSITCLMVLRDAQLQDKCTDDRPPITPPGWISKLNEKAAALLDKYPDPPEAYINEESGSVYSEAEKAVKDKPLGHQMVIKVEGDGVQDINDMLIILKSTSVPFKFGFKFEYVSDKWPKDEDWKPSVDCDYVPCAGETITFTITEEV